MFCTISSSLENNKQAAKYLVADKQNPSCVFFQEQIEKLKRISKVSTHENGSFKYLGLEVVQTAGRVQIK